MSKIKMRPGWEKDMAKAVRPATENIASDYQKEFDSLLRRYKGRPVSEIKPMLRRECSRVGGSISDAGLTEYATHLSEGTRIQMRVK